MPVVNEIHYSVPVTGRLYLQLEGLTDLVGAALMAFFPYIALKKTLCICIVLEKFACFC